VLHDRRNTGRSDVLIEGDVAEEILWLDDLHELLKQLNALPAFVGGSSAGARTAMRFYIRFRNDVLGLLLMRVTGGAFAANRLPEMYYGQFIKAAQQGGMAAVCATEQYQERIQANPQTGERLMAMDPQRYIKVMSNWREQFIESTKLEVFGMTKDDLNSIAVPTVLIPGNDQTHASENGRIAARAIPGCVLHQLPIEDQQIPLIGFPEWAPHYDEIVRVFIELMKRAQPSRARTGQAAAS
jgi:pimeloyl-ACP methyl ester carboxylesterase